VVSAGLVLVDEASAGEVVVSTAGAVVVSASVVLVLVLVLLVRVLVVCAVLQSKEMVGTWMLQLGLGLLG
jgi:hypothetical protein